MARVIVLINHKEAAICPLLIWSAVEKSRHQTAFGIHHNCLIWSRWSISAKKKITDDTNWAVLRFFFLLRAVAFLFKKSYPDGLLIDTGRLEQTRIHIPYRFLASYHFLRLMIFFVFFLQVIDLINSNSISLTRSSWAPGCLELIYNNA